jgi:hypothetical protein
MTPTCEAILSPIDRAIANPGIFSFFSQTREGPTGFPKKSDFSKNCFIFNQKKFQKLSLIFSNHKKKKNQ